MELRRYWSLLRRRALLLMVAMGVALGVTAASTDQTKLYTAESTLYVGLNSFLPNAGYDPNLSGDQTNGLGQLIRTFAELIDSEAVASDALELTGIQRSAGAVVARTTATPEPGTSILRIQVSDTDPAAARGLANGMAEAFVNKISTLEPGRVLGEGDLPSAPARVFERAQLPTVPQQTSLISRLMVSGLLALLGSAGLILLLEYLDVTIKGRSDAEDQLELPVLGVIPLLRIDPTSTARRARPTPRDAPPMRMVSDQ